MYKKTQYYWRTPSTCLNHTAVDARLSHNLTRFLIQTKRQFSNLCSVIKHCVKYIKFHDFGKHFRLMKRKLVNVTIRMSVKRPLISAQNHNTRSATVKLFMYIY